LLEAPALPLEDGAGGVHPMEMEPRAAESESGSGAFSGAKCAGCIG
jgi:hypothetical protein